MQNNLIQKRFTQLFLIHFIGETWYILTLIFIHKSYNSLWFLFAILLGNLVCLYRYQVTGNYEKYGGIIFLLGSIFMACLVYLAGGMSAPAPFTFALIPMAAAFFFEDKYLKPSFIWAILLLGVTIGMAEIVPPAELKMDYEKQKVMNTLFFIIAFYACVSSFIQTIRIKDLKITRQRDDIQNLLQIVIHDIASPLTVAMARTSLMMREEQESNKYDALNRSLNSIAAIISDVKRLEQVSNGKLVLENEEIELKSLCGLLESDFESLLAEKELKLNIECESSIFFKGDLSIIKNNILTNILTNAIKFSSRGAVIDLKVELEDELVIEVTDYGVGIPPEIKEIIFSSNKPTTRIGTEGEKGTGFGLPIVKKLVDLMGGKIEIESYFPSRASEIGTKVVIKLKKN